MDPPNSDGIFYPISPPASAPPQPPPPPPLGVPVDVNGLILHPSPTAPTTVVHVPQRLPVAWSSGLCDCLDDIPSCLLTCLCPCITFGQIAEIVDGGATSCGASGALYAMIMSMTGCSWVFSCFYRSKLRGQYFLEESPCSDCLVHCCCEHCSLCQEYRELKNHGFDLNLGWQGNIERKARAVYQRPAIEGGMSR